MKFDYQDHGFGISVSGEMLFGHVPHMPCLFVGRGDPEISCYHGNFKINDYVQERIALRHCLVREVSDVITADFSAYDGTDILLSMTFDVNASQVRLAFKAHDPSLNRIWLKLKANRDEKFWGGGEQMSYFNLRGRHFPLFTSEPGVGRDKSSAITLQADVTGQSGGDYYNTNYPQPTFLSSRHYACHLETTAYCALDFRHDSFVELEAWAIPKALELYENSSFIGLVGELSNRFGKPLPLPDWVHDGAIIGLKEGEKKLFQATDNPISRRSYCGALV